MATTRKLALALAAGMLVGGLIPHDRPDERKAASTLPDIAAAIASEDMQRPRGDTSFNNAEPVQRQIDVPAPTPQNS